MYNVHHRSPTIVFGAPHRAVLFRGGDYRRQEGLLAIQRDNSLSERVIRVGSLVAPGTAACSAQKSRIARSKRDFEEMIGDTRKCRQQRLRELLPAAYCLIRLMTRRKRDGG